MVTGLIGARIKAREGDEGIAALEGYALKRIDQAPADNAANASDFAQARVILLTIGVGLNESLDFASATLRTVVAAPRPVRERTDAATSSA